MATRPPVVLTIAGSDSGAGAGIQADARVIQAGGGYACTAITALTAQNTTGVLRVVPVDTAMVAEQIEAVLSDMPVAAVKTGLLPGAGVVETIARTLSQHRRLPLVIDPVLGSTSGTRFLDQAGIVALKTWLIPLATLITPNLPEAEQLSRQTITTRAEGKNVARALALEYGCWVLLKGGHFSDPQQCTDLLVSPQGEITAFSSPRLATHNTHGTGCSLSAAISLGLAQGLAVVEAVARGRSLLQEGLHRGQSWQWGAGAGPAFPGSPSGK